MEKIKTQIEGLDTLLNGGITMGQNNTVVALRGERGINKTLMALQMMYGLSLGDPGFNTLFFSLNKKADSLTEMLKCIVISKAIESIKKGEECRDTWTDIFWDNFEFRDAIKNDAVVFNPDTRELQDKREGRSRVENITKDIDLQKNSRYEVYEVRKNPDNLSQPRGMELFGELVCRINKILKQVQPEDRKASRYGCIVVDGFSSFSSDELSRMPINALISNLRKISKISIIVLDERLETQNANVDILIDMRRGYDKLHSYTHHELQITKCVFQSSAYGWHKYKSFGGMIYVFPSVHKVMQQGVSVNTTFMRAINDDMRFDKSFMDCYKMQPNVNRLQYTTTQWAYEAPYPDKHDGAVNNNSIPPKDFLTKILCSKNATTSNVTALVGANNTFKRYLSAISILNDLVQKKNVFVMLLNEKKLGIQQLIDKVRRDANISISSATDLYKRLYIWEVRMGCISPEELLYFINEVINIRQKENTENRETEDSKDNKDASRDKYPLSLYIADMSAIDYCFPMLRNESLFIPTLSILCRERHTSLTLVCNKHFSLVDSICSVSDNLLCLTREPSPSSPDLLIADNITNNPNTEVRQGNADPQKGQEETTTCHSLTILVEKNTFGPAYSSRVFEIKIKDIRQLIPTTSSPETIEIPLREGEDYVHEIPTTKDFWRQAVNVKNVVDVKLNRNGRE